EQMFVNGTSHVPNQAFFFVDIFIPPQDLPQPNPKRILTEFIFKNVLSIFKHWVTKKVLPNHCYGCRNFNY
ncbi:hypothetical protein ACQP3C_31065, partial [Escherichia coli]